MIKINEVLEINEKSRTVFNFKEIERRYIYRERERVSPTLFSPAKKLIDQKQTIRSSLRS